MKTRNLSQKTMMIIVVQVYLVKGHVSLEKRINRVSEDEQSQ